MSDKPSRHMLAAVADWLSGHKGQHIGPGELARLLKQDQTGVTRALRYLAHEHEGVQRAGPPHGPGVTYVMLAPGARLPAVREAAQAPGPRQVPPPAPDPVPAPEPDGRMSGLPPEGMLQIIGVASGHSGFVMARDHGGQVWMLTPVG